MTMSAQHELQRPLTAFTVRDGQHRGVLTRGGGRGRQKSSDAGSAHEAHHALNCLTPPCSGCRSTAASPMLT